MNAVKITGAPTHFLARYHLKRFIRGGAKGREKRRRRKILKMYSTTGICEESIIFHMRNLHTRIKLQGKGEVGPLKAPGSVLMSYMAARISPNKLFRVLSDKKNP